MVGHYLRDPELVMRHSNRAVAIAERGAPVREINGLLVSTMLGFAYLQAQETAEALSLLEQSLAFLEGMVARGADTPRWPHEIALIHAARGDREAALAWLETAYDRGFRWTWMLEREPMLDALRDDPRFQGVLARMRAEVDAMRRQLRVGIM
jgi:adenylate cyclase